MEIKEAKTISELLGIGQAFQRMCNTLGYHIDGEGTVDRYPVEMPYAGPLGRFVEYDSDVLPLKYQRFSVKDPSDKDRQDCKEEMKKLICGLEDTSIEDKLLPELDSMTDKRMTEWKEYASNRFPVYSRNFELLLHQFNIAVIEAEK